MNECFRLVENEKAPAKGAYIGLGPPGEAGSWQRDCKVRNQIINLKRFCRHFLLFVCEKAGISARFSDLKHKVKSLSYQL